MRRDAWATANGNGNSNGNGNGIYHRGHRGAPRNDAGEGTNRQLQFKNAWGCDVVGNGNCL